jgi:hypothetical protein
MLSSFFYIIIQFLTPLFDIESTSLVVSVIAQLMKENKDTSEDSTMMSTTPSPYKIARKLSRYDKCTTI